MDAVSPFVGSDAGSVESAGVDGVSVSLSGVVVPGVLSFVGSVSSVAGSEDLSTFGVVLVVSLGVSWSPGVVGVWSDGAVGDEDVD